MKEIKDIIEEIEDLIYNSLVTDLSNDKEDDFREILVRLKEAIYKHQDGNVMLDKDFSSDVMPDIETAIHDMLYNGYHPIKRLIHITATTKEK